MPFYMKKLIVLIIILFSLKISAQVDSIPVPSGFTQYEMRSKNILRVSPDNHVWIGFTRIGAAEYDGSSWRIFTDTNGLPSKNVTAFAFEGSIKWIGTDSGFVKTDGVSFVTYNSSNSPLPSNKINYLFKSDTLLWIATDSGAVSFDGTNWNIYNTSNSSLTSNSVLCFNENNYGLYATLNYEIFLLKNNNWKLIGPIWFQNFRINSDRSGHLFTGGYQIYDTVLIPLSFPSDPCFFQDYLTNKPDYFLGGTINNKSYVIIDAGFIYSFYIAECDSLLNIVRIYYELDDSFKQALNVVDYRPQLYDFNNTGEIISTTNVNSRRTIIYKTNFSGINLLQPPDTCPYLDVNQVRARIWNNGSMFWDLTGNALYETPKGSGKTPIFAEGLWIGGRDSQDKIHIAAQTYRLSGSDFWPGPLDTINASIDSSVYRQYDKLWKIDRYTVNDFIYNYRNGSVANGTYLIPDIIQNWPAHGTGSISRSLAPFVDNNHDGIYRPFDGDYPKIKGDQMFWWVFNDNFSSHGETRSPYNLGVEIHGCAYAYNCPLLINGDSVINYTTFYHYDIFNRSDTAYHDVYLGIYTDVDLGDYLDDFVGCDTVIDVAFAYNGDDDDRYYDSGYGLHPPMINLAFLKGPEASPNDTIDNNHNGTIDEPGENCMMNYFIYWNSDPTAIGNPTSALNYYYRMQGRWLDNSHMVYGGSGYDRSSTNYTNYMFSGPPYDTTSGWSESHPCSGCISNEPSDRRIFVSSGPFDLPAHSKRSLDYAYVFTREPNYPNGPNTSLAVNRDQVMRIKHFFETDSFPCTHLFDIDDLKNEELSVNLYPNPAHLEIFVSTMITESVLKTFFITDILGKEILKTKTFSPLYYRINLTSFKPGIYFLHLQANDKSCVRKFIVE